MYAYMPIGTQKLHPLMRALPAALRVRMDALGHSQMEVSALTGVPQPQISRALSGSRKRPTPAMLELCRYASLELGKAEAASGAAREVTLLMQLLIGDSAPAAAQMKAVLRSLAPLMSDYRNRPVR